jgi:nicotinic acid phosphoribosyltransferase
MEFHERRPTYPDADRRVNCRASRRWLRFDSSSADRAARRFGMKRLGTMGKALLGTFEAVGQFAGLRLLLAAAVILSAAWLTAL